VPVAGACAAMTERIGIGLGIVNFYQHHPTLIAAEFAALDELAGGRVRLGIGSGIGQRVFRLGLKWRSLPQPEDAVENIRPRMRGEQEYHRRTSVSGGGVGLGFLPPPPG